MRRSSLLPAKDDRRNLWFVRRLLGQLRLDRRRTEPTSSVSDKRVASPCESSQEESNLFAIKTALARADICDSKARWNIFVRLLRRRKRNTGGTSVLSPLLSADTASKSSRR